MSSECPHCGLAYDDFRTGEDFSSVRRLMFTASTDPADWRQKRRRCVLGFWHELKVNLFRAHVQECAWIEQQQRAEQRCAL